MRALHSLYVSTALATIVSGSLLVAADAFAQPASASGQTTATGLEEIVVTAQRREENLQRAAIAVTAATGEELARAGVSDTTQLTRIAPSLQIGSLNGSFNQLYLRGVGNFTSNSLSDAAVSVNLDGVPLARSAAVQGIFYDLERVEVLKGPQGTLYGRNATGGAVNVISVKPVLGEINGYITGQYGNFDAVKVTGALNVPIGDKTSVRVAGLMSDRDGYYSDGTGDEELSAIRAQLLTEPSESFRLIVGGDVAHLGGVGAGATIHGLDHDDRIGSFDPRASAVYARTYSPVAGSFLPPVPNDSFVDNTYWGAYAQADLDTPLGALTVIPAYRKSDINYKNHVGSTFNDRTDADQASLEVRLASDDANRLNYLLGAFYIKENVLQRITIHPQYLNVNAVLDSDTASYAGFGRVTFKVTDALRLTGGIRYTVDEKSAALDAYQSVVVCPAAFVGGNCFGSPRLPDQLGISPMFVFPNGDPIPVVPWGTSGAIVSTTRNTNTPSKTFRKTTYRVGFEYDVGEQSLIYGTYETGFKAGGFFSSPTPPDTFAPETISAFTLGSKNRFMDNRVQLNLEAFYWTYKDQQVTHFRFDGAGGFSAVTDNIGETRIAGIEIEAKAVLREGTTAYGTVQYLDAEMRDFVFFNAAAAGPPNLGCPYTLVGPEYRVNCSGRRPTNAPEWTVNGGIEQVFRFANDAQLILNADGRYQSSSYTGFEQLPVQVQKGYFTLDLQAEYKFPGDQLSVSGFVNNVTDENVVGFSIPHPFGPSAIVETLRPPRTYGVRVGYTF
jgi:iron complex outermembrane recepter protein